MVTIEVTVNNEKYTSDIEDNLSLYDYLKKIHINSIKSACYQGDCGICTVLVDDIVVKSCLSLAAEFSGSKIYTIEGLIDDPTMKVLFKAFEKAGAVQCGYCSPAFLIRAYSLLKSSIIPLENISPKQIVESINGILCRCTGYKQIIEGIHEACIILSKVDH
ncbi:MAG: (2Fe-2S)-binding protein [Candidatus Thorarchaeota archaeon]